VHFIDIGWTTIQARSQNIVRGGHRLQVEGHQANEGDITIA